MHLPPRPQPARRFQLAGTGGRPCSSAGNDSAKGSESQPHDGAFKFVLWALLMVSAEWWQGWRGAGGWSRGQGGGAGGGPGGGCEAGRGPTGRGGVVGLGGGAGAGQGRGPVGTAPCPCREACHQSGPW